MKALIPLLTVAPVIATAMTGGAVEAQGLHQSRHAAHHVEGQRHQHVLHPRPPSEALDPYGVYFGGVEVGRDPDPNVRRELYNDYMFIYGW